MNPCNDCLLAGGKELYSPLAAPGQLKAHLLLRERVAGEAIEEGPARGVRAIPAGRIAEDVSNGELERVDDVGVVNVQVEGRELLGA